jgi:hypothetical protein
MNIYMKYTFFFFTFAFFYVTIAGAQTVPEIIGNPTAVADTTDGMIISYSPEPFQPLRLLFDYYHHSLPSTKIGSHLVTGSYLNSVGRYGWDDFVHSNTFDPVFVALEKEYSISMSRKTFSEKLLSETDAVVIMNPDNPLIFPSARILSDEEISILRKFVNNGGSLMVMVNSGGAARESESFENVQLRKLTRGFGLDWNDDDTHYSNNLIQKGHPYFYDVPVFHYGAGCTLQILLEASSPEILLNVYSEECYTDRHVNGPGIVMVRPGKGKFILVGDVGTWTANLSRPWADNELILRQLFRYLKPDRGVTPPQLTTGKTWQYEVKAFGLQGIPVLNSLSQVTKPHYRLFSPRPITNMPYFEASALLNLTCREQTKDQASILEAKVTDFRWFDEQPENKGDHTIRFTASRQGKVSGMEASGYIAQWLAPDVPVIIALLPVDGLHPGDRWESDEYLRVPIIRGSDLAPVKPHNLEITYVGDRQIGDKNCRLLRSSGEIWLDEMGIQVEDLLPLEEVRRVGGSHYQYLNKRGGKFLFKREQWVDQNTGTVVKARIQTRIFTWVQDTNKPASIAPGKSDIVMSLAYIVTFQLREPVGN